MRKRITALLLAFVMTASLLPVTAQAVSPEAEAQAAVITTAAEFAAMAPDGNYRLEADITVDEPYGRTFTGSFDGAPPYHHHRSSCLGRWTGRGMGPIRRAGRRGGKRPPSAGRTDCGRGQRCPEPGRTGRYGFRRHGYRRLPQ